MISMLFRKDPVKKLLERISLLDLLLNPKIYFDGVAYFTSDTALFIRELYLAVKKVFGSSPLLREIQHLASLLGILVHILYEEKYSYEVPSEQTVHLVNAIACIVIGEEACKAYLESIPAEDIPSAEDYRKAREIIGFMRGLLLKILEALPYVIKKPVRLELHGDYEIKSRYITMKKKKEYGNIYEIVQAV